MVTIPFAARAFAGALALAFAACATPAVAADDDPGLHVRGTVIALAGDALQVRTREGPAVTIALAPGFTVSAVTRLGLADIKPGDYVGIATEKTVAGDDGALEVLVFPSAMRGAGEGRLAWDLKPQTAMTDGTVSAAADAVDGRTVTVSARGQPYRIAVTAGTPVVTLVPAAREDVQPGADVFLYTQASADGALSARGVIVGRGGVRPPM